MKRQGPLVARFTTTLAAIVAALLAVVPPVGYFTLADQYAAGAAQSRAQAAAALTSAFLGGQPDTWQFQVHRLEEILQRASREAPDDQYRILDARGAGPARARGEASLAGRGHGGRAVRLGRVGRHGRDRAVAAAAAHSRRAHRGGERGDRPARVRAPPPAAVARARAERGAARGRVADGRPTPSSPSAPTGPSAPGTPRPSASSGLRRRTPSTAPSPSSSSPSPGTRSSPRWRTSLGRALDRITPAPWSCARAGRTAT